MVFAISLHIKSDNKSLIDFYTTTICNLLKSYQISTSYPFALPHKISKFTVLRSPHVYKKSREQFEYHVFSYFINIYCNNDIELYRKIFFILTFLKYQLPAGITIKFKNTLKV